MNKYLRMIVTLFNRIYTYYFIVKVDYVTVFRYYKETFNVLLSSAIVRIHHNFLSFSKN